MEITDKKLIWLNIYQRNDNDHYVGKVKLLSTELEKRGLLVEDLPTKFSLAFHQSVFVDEVIGYEFTIVGIPSINKFFFVVFDHSNIYIIYQTNLILITICFFSFFIRQVYTSILEA